MGIRIELWRGARARAVAEYHGNLCDTASAETPDVMPSPERVEVSNNDAHDDEPEVGDVVGCDVHHHRVETELAEHDQTAVQLTGSVIAG